MCQSRVTCTGGSRNKWYFGEKEWTSRSLRLKPPSKPSSQGSNPALRVTQERLEEVGTFPRPVRITGTPEAALIPCRQDGNAHTSRLPSPLIIPTPKVLMSDSTEITTLPWGWVRSSNRSLVPKCQGLWLVLLGTPVPQAGSGRSLHPRQSRLSNSPSNPCLCL